MKTQKVENSPKPQSRKSNLSSSSSNYSLKKSPRLSKKRSSKKSVQNGHDQTTQNAVTQLKHAIENLERRQDKLEEQINRSDARAREYQKANNKQSAIQSLKKKKALEQQLQQLDNQITNMEGKLQALEAAQINLVVYRNSVTAKDSLTRLNKQASTCEVDDAVFEFEQQNIIAENISRTMGSPRRVDSGNWDDDGAISGEEDLLAELEALEMEECSPSSIMPTT